MDRKIQQAIRDAVAEAGQDPGLARKLESWFEALASGSEDSYDKQSAYRHLILLYEETHVQAISQRGSAAFSFDDESDEETA